ncbi:SURF1 family protein [Catenovulum sp. 2E275]|uniref:SURF1 family protein n=1 Tax=Catenovulum sp. 2E275 TaxID=2980497 RepID=UPI0021CE2D1F|nr:SURF1 family protein [Catenovulum sp. 2E275]MCU4674431.1 SURF1 family protein [Catenovulum sp. 2E275]
MILTLGRFQLIVKIWPSLIFLVCCSILIKLGLWQLDRAELKQNRQQKLAMLNSQNRVNLTELLDKSVVWAKYQDVKVNLTGSVVKPFVWFIENQVVDNQVGADCIVAVEVKSGNKAYYLLLNLGWVAINQNRQPILPNVITERVENLAVRLVVPKHNYFMGTQIIAGKTYSFIQQVDIEVLSKSANLEFLPILAVVDDFSVDAFKPHWQPIVMPAKKHYGYAIQWFGLAGALSIIILIKAGRWNKSIQQKQ